MTTRERMQLVQSLAAGLEYAGGHDGSARDCAQCKDVIAAGELVFELAHEVRLEDPENALTRVTDYLRDVVANLQNEQQYARDYGCSWTAAQLERRIYDTTDAAVIIMARRADMALERRRHQEKAAAAAPGSPAEELRAERIRQQIAGNRG